MFVLELGFEIHTRFFLVLFCFCACGVGMELVGFMCNSMTVSFPSGRRVWIYSTDSGVIWDGSFKA